MASAGPSSRARALGLLSGGLDSSLAARILLEQGIEVLGITFLTPFFGAARARKAAAALGIPLRVLDITGEHLAMVKAPPHGYGKNMNPCIDCHALMFAKAGGLMGETGGHFLFSGEVLGQRPMSQNLRSLELVERLSGFSGLILRPLSALLLPETPMERGGLVDRTRLLDLSGRSRRRQMELAARLGLTDYPAPAGGCLLTDPAFSLRLKELLAAAPGAGEREVELLKLGRHYRLPGGSKAIVGRDQEDNEALERSAAPGDRVLALEGIPGPLTLLTPPHPEKDILLAAAITAAHSKAAGRQRARVLVQGEGTPRTLEVAPLPREDLARWKIGY